MLSFYIDISAGTVGAATADKPCESAVTVALCHAVRHRRNNQKCYIHIYTVQLQSASAFYGQKAPLYAVVSKLASEMLVVHSVRYKWDYC